MSGMTTTPLTPSDVATRYGVHPLTVCYHIRQGHVVASVTGTGRYLITPAAARKLAKRQGWTEVQP